MTSPTSGFDTPSPPAHSADGSPPWAPRAQRTRLAPPVFPTPPLEEFYNDVLSDGAPRKRPRMATEPLFLPVDTTKRCQDVFKVTPKDLQLKVVDNIGRGQDCILIAGCGWGKTLVYFLPLILWTDRVIVVISPLKALMEEQCRKLKDLDISATMLTGDVLEKDTFKKLVTGAYRAVFMTPEIIFKSKRFKSLWHNGAWRDRLLAVVLDEAHCVSTWGTTFRPSYGCVGDLRALLRPGIAIVAVSATLPAQALQDVKSKVRFREDVAVFNVGNDRPNVRLEVRYFGSKSRLSHLDFLTTDVKKTIVYFDSRSETTEALSYLEDLAPDALKPKIAAYHAILSEGCKIKILREFAKGDIMLLLSTEAAGMGCDISDVARVVQFKRPPSILTLVQRIGRAARSPRHQGQGILIVPRPTPETTFDDPHLAQYITTTDCRRKVLNTVFGNESLPNGNCCDLCHPLLETPDPPQDFVFKDSTAACIQKARTPKRTPHQKELAKAAIRDWRREMFQTYYLPLCDFFTECCVMVDGSVDKLGEKSASVTSAESIKSIIAWTPLQPWMREHLASTLISLNKEMDGEVFQLNATPVEVHQPSLVPARPPSVVPARQIPQILSNRLDPFRNSSASSIHDGNSKRLRLFR